MLLRTAFLSISILSVPILLAQTSDGCDGARYRYRIFDEIQVEYDVVYGNNINASGSNEELVMDIYRPAGDTVSNRATAVCAHGGFFMTGANDAFDIVPLCEDLARMGYVAVSISYRLGIDDFFSLEESLQEAVVRGVQDGKAAVRYLRRSHAELGNPYGIDPSRIVMGGTSAGAFIGLHAAYVEEDEIPAYVDMTQQGLSGGIEGASGSPGYSSEVISLFSISGAIADASWIEVGDIPLVSTHGDEDGTVPYGTGPVEIVGLDVTTVDGSETIHAQLDDLEIENCFHTFPGAGHVPHQYYNTYYDTTRAVVIGFTSAQVCPVYEPICEWYDVDSPPAIECVGDIVPDGVISVPDILAILSEFGCVSNCIADLDGDEEVGVSDILIILSVYGEFCE